MKRTGLIAAIIAVLVIGGGAYTLSQNKTDDKKAPSSGEQATATNTQTSTNPTPAEESSANIITYSENGFSPSKTTIKAGEKITIKNTANHQLELDSDPHPAHTDDRELNIGSVAPGTSQTATLTTKGTWGYHNHLNSTDTGTIIVE